MTVREIRLYGDPVLRTPSEPIAEITDGVRRLVEDLLDTTREPGRAGVAACQIGVSLRAFSYNVDGKIGYLLNPRIVELGGELREVEEGCLSVPEQYNTIERYERATATGIDLDGNDVTIEAEGFMAQMLQHECDHQDGIVYIQKLSRERRGEAMRRMRESSWFGLH